VVASTGEVREDDERGRHTTTHRELFVLPAGSPGEGALVIDTPGLREVQLWAGEEAVEASFADIEALAADCRFRDCSHGEEPGCAVREALASGSLDAGRYGSWRKLMREVAFLERKEDLTLARAEAERWRAINKSMRGYTKERRSIQGKAR
jgi:ribosome biogenesis GTPase